LHRGGSSDAHLDGRASNSSNTENADDARGAGDDRSETAAEPRGQYLAVRLAQLVEAGPG
jgi:hypothetical protein